MPLQAGQTVAQEGQLGLQLAFVGHGTAAEDLEDEHGAVDDLEAAEGRGDVADPAAGQLTVEDGALDPSSAAAAAASSSLPLPSTDAGLRGVWRFWVTSATASMWLASHSAASSAKAALAVPQALVEGEKDDLRRGVSTKIS